MLISKLKEFIQFQSMREQEFLTKELMVYERKTYGNARCT